jgi:hypothetical protein
MDLDSSSLPTQTPATGYDFHDPGFVTWWLNSLYLFPTQDQIAIAERLRDAVHAPESQQEIVAFIEVRLDAVRGASEQRPRPYRGDPEMGSSANWRPALRRSWAARPWLTGIGVLGALFFAGKGIWFLGLTLAQSFN